MGSIELTGRRESDRDELIGRSQELETLREALRDGYDCVTIVGPPGVGKTVVARRVARDLLGVGTYDAGVWYCSLRDARTRDDVMAELGQAFPLDFRQTAEFEESLVRLVDWLDGRETLLVLDDPEPVSDVLVDLISEFLPDLDDLQLLVASRERFGLDLEYVYSLPPLEVSDAVELYRRSAESSGLDDDADDGSLEQLVERLDCMPLAIELAAAQLPVMRPSDLLSSLDEHLDLLREPSRDSGDWNSPLRETIAWSWDQLEEWQRSGLVQSALFQGSFSLQAMRSVVSLGDDADAPSPVRALHALARKSLVRVERQTDDLRTFALYRSVAEFARGVDEIPLDAARRRYVSYYVERAPELASMTETAENARARREFELAYGDYAEAFDEAVELDPCAAARLAIALTKLTYVSSPQRETDERVRLALDALDRAEAPAETTRRLRARLHLVRSHFWTTAYHPPTEEIGANLERALEIVDPEADRRLYAELQAHYGRFVGSVGRFEEAESRLREALSIAEETDHEEARIRAAANLGLIGFRRGELESARSRLGEAVARAEQEGLLRLQCKAQNLLAVLEGSFGRLRRAEAQAEQARATAEKLELTAEQLHAVATIGASRAALGELESAGAQLERGLERARTTGHRFQERPLLFELGAVEMLQFELESAALRFDRCVGMARAQQRPIPEVHAYCRLAAVDFLRGHLSAGDECLQQAHRVAERAGHYRAHQIVDAARTFREVGRAVAALEEGEHDRARGLLSEVRPSVPSASDGDEAPPSKNFRVHLEVRIQRLAIDALRDRHDPLLEADEGSVEAFEVADDGNWFRTAEGERVDLSKRRAPRQILAHLAQKRADAPGSESDVFELLEAGWPDEQVHPESGKARVYTAVRTLRELGLDDVLLTGDEGYYLDPDTPFLVGEDETAS